MPLGPAAGRRGRAGGRGRPRAAAGGGSRGGGPGGEPAPPRDSPKAVLDAFFLGRAAAQVAGEVLQEAVGQLLAEAGTLGARQQEFLAEFQQDVQRRAALDMQRTYGPGVVPGAAEAEAGSSASASEAEGAEAAARPEDGRLREGIADARALLRELRRAEEANDAGAAAVETVEEEVQVAEAVVVGDEEEDPAAGSEAS